MQIDAQGSVTFVSSNRKQLYKRISMQEISGYWSPDLLFQTHDVQFDDDPDDSYDSNLESKSDTDNEIDIGESIDSNNFSNTASDENDRRYKISSQEFYEKMTSIFTASKCSYAYYILHPTSCTVRLQLNRSKSKTVTSVPNVIYIYIYICM